MLFLNRQEHKPANQNYVRVLVGNDNVVKKEVDFRPRCLWIDAHVHMVVRGKFFDLKHLADLGHSADATDMQAQGRAAGGAKIGIN